MRCRGLNRQRSTPPREYSAVCQRMQVTARAVVASPSPCTPPQRQTYSSATTGAWEPDFVRRSTAGAAPSVPTERLETPETDTAVPAWLVFSVVLLPLTTSGIMPCTTWRHIRRGKRGATVSTRQPHIVREHRSPGNQQSTSAAAGMTTRNSYHTRSIDTRQQSTGADHTSLSISITVTMTLTRQERPSQKQDKKPLPNHGNQAKRTTF